MVVLSRTKEPRIIGEISPLIVQLEEAESRAAKYRREEDAPSASSLPSDIHELIGCIKAEIRSVADIFHKLEIWEREMKGKIEDVAKVIDDALEFSSSEYELHSKLLTVKGKASVCRERLIAVDSPLRLKCLEDFVESLPSSIEPLPCFSSPPSSSTVHAEEDIKSFLDIKSTVFVDRSGGLQHFAIIPLFLGILPTGSLIKKKTLHCYCQWALSTLEFYHARHTFRRVELPERQMELTEETTDMFLEYLGRHGIINCIYKDHKPWEIDSCTINPLARKALNDLASSDRWLRIYAKQIRDPLTLRSCLFPEQYEATFSERAYVNINHRYMKFSGNKLEEMRENCIVLMLGSFHASAKDNHIEIANEEFVNSVGSFVNLRCLSLRGISRITEIPSSFGNLGQLRILDLRACYDLQSLPVELTRLHLLEHLDVSECYFLTHMPKGVESLRELRVLKGFVVGSPQGHDSCQLSELSKLSKLKKLSISVARDSILEEEQFGKLSFLRSMVSLTITWAVGASASTNTADSTATKNTADSTASLSSIVLTVNEGGISPPPNLEKLDLRCIPHSTKPQWLDARKLSKLKRLYIRAGKLNLQSLCAPGQTWDSVEVIRLRFLQGVDLEDASLHSAFPNLDYSEVWNGSKFDYQWASPHQEEGKRKAAKYVSMF